jgi:hypothetical protein
MTQEELRQLVRSVKATSPEVTALTIKEDAFISLFLQIEYTRPRTLEDGYSPVKMSVMGMDIYCDKK